MAIAVPVRQRRRTIAVVLALALDDSFNDEEARARFCAAWQMDRTVCERMVSDVPRFSPETLQTYTGLLARDLESLTTIEVAHRHVNDLSARLARANEELNLIYRIGVGSSVSTPPLQHFASLCRELVGATKIESLAVVLESPTLSAGPSLVRAGPLEASDAGILRLYAQLQDQDDDTGPAVVLNGLGTDPALAWAAAWLQSLVFSPLTGKDRRLGGILAINHDDGGDLGSYEVHLLGAVAERSSVFLENARLYDDLEELFIGMLHALVSSIDAKDPYTCGHSQRVAWLSRFIARLRGMPEEKCQRVYLSGLLHDIGKIGISEAVLCKTGRLTSEEFQEMRRHPEIGARIVEGVPQVADTIPGILHHHERMDGKGYPSRLAGYDIPILGRIVGLADSYDAMTTNRTYRKARPVLMALSEIRRCSGTQFDPELADLLLQQDVHAMHRELTEFGNQPIGMHQGRQSVSWHGGQGQGEKGELL